MISEVRKKRKREDKLFLLYLLKDLIVKTNKNEKHKNYLVKNLYDYYFLKKTHKFS